MVDGACILVGREGLRCWKWAVVANHRSIGALDFQVETANAFGGLFVSFRGVTTDAEATTRAILKQGKEPRVTTDLSLGKRAEAAILIFHFKGGGEEILLGCVNPKKESPCILKYEEAATAAIEKALEEFGPININLNATYTCATGKVAL